MAKMFKEWATVRTRKNKRQVNLGNINGRLYTVPGDRKAEVTVPYTKLTRAYVENRRLVLLSKTPNKNAASNPDLKKQENQETEEEEKEQGEGGSVVTEDNTVEEIKAWLDKEGVEYKTNQTKAELLDLVRNT